MITRHKTLAACLSSCSRFFDEYAVLAPEMSAPGHGFKGNKAALPTKPCAHCGRPMSWRKAWASSWVEVKYCSDACRRDKAPGAKGPAR